MKNSLMAAGLVSMLAFPAAASDEHKETIPKAQIFGGYSLAREDGTNVHGIAASVQFNLSKWLAIGVETSRHSEEDHGASVVKNSYLLGPRFSRRGGKVVPFVYVLGGIERTKSEVSIGSISISEAESEPAVALGGGIDIELSHKWAIAIEANDLLVRSHGSTHGTFRFGAGIVYSIGEK